MSTCKSIYLLNKPSLNPVYQNQARTCSRATLPSKKNRIQVLRVTSKPHFYLQLEYIYIYIYIYERKIKGK